MTGQRKLRMGMVGGGPGAFIGPVHRIAAELDGKIELVAGAFSQSAERSRQAGEAYKIEPERAYGDYKSMLESERKRQDPIDFVAIVTPNHLHLPVALAALTAGFPVMSDKPATATYQEALELEKAVAKSGLPYGLTHTYAGYALVREARAICASGALGKIRKVAVEYLQGWLANPIEATGQKQASWRSDPAQSGLGGCIGDIGVHAFHLTEYVTGLNVIGVSASLLSVVEGRKLDDDCTALVRMDNAAVPAGVEIAPGKARTAALFRRPSGALEDAINGNRPAAATARGFVLMRGGLPLVADGQVVGAIGVSADTPQHDEDIAKAGVAALK